MLPAERVTTTDRKQNPDPRNPRGIDHAEIQKPYPNASPRGAEHKALTPILGANITGGILSPDSGQNIKRDGHRPLKAPRTARFPIGL